MAEHLAQLEKVPARGLGHREPLLRLGWAQQVPEHGLGEDERQKVVHLLDVAARDHVVDELAHLLPHLRAAGARVSTRFSPRQTHKDSVRTSEPQPRR